MNLNFLRLFKVLPPWLKIAWGLLLIGFLTVVVALFAGPCWLGSAGWGCFIGGYGMVILSFFISRLIPDRYRSSKNPALHRFYGGFALANLFLLPALIVLSALLLAILYGAGWLFDMGSPRYTLMQYLHMAGVVFAFLVVSTLSRFDGKLKDEKAPGQPDEADGQ